MDMWRFSASAPHRANRDTQNSFRNNSPIDSTEDVKHILRLKNLDGLQTFMSVKAVVQETFSHVEVNRLNARLSSRYRTA